MILELKRKAAPLAVLAILLGAFTLWETSNSHLIRAATVDLMVVIAALLVVIPRVRWTMPVVVPLLVAGTLGQFASQAEVHLSVLIPAVLGFVSAVLLARGVEVGRYLDVVLRFIGRALETAVGALAFTLVITPAWAWTRLRRREVLRTSGAAEGPTWATRSDKAAPGSLAASPEHVGGNRTLPGRLAWATGCVGLLLIVNFGAGWLWDQKYPTDPPAPPPEQEQSVTATDLPPDPRADSPAMADAPWKEQYFDEIRRTPANYWPFTEYRPADYTSTYVNQRDWARVSYEPKGDADDMPTVWMFGGSTTWGEGQRDEFTIASYLARIAEDEGIPLQIVNYGSRGWVHFQEMILYEQLLANTTPPDISLFNDGANEITSQSLLDEAVPTHVLTYSYAKKLTGGTIATQFVPPPTPETNTMDDAIAAYEQHSAVHKIVNWFRGRAAGASPALDDSGDTGDGGDGGSDPALTDQPTADEDGYISNYNATPEDGRDAADVYNRGKKLTMELSKEYDVDSLLFWHPVRYAGPPEEQARKGLTDPTIDLGDALDGHDEDIYIDGVHTNEEGARLMAVEIWKHLEPKVRSWYEANR
ncbi:MAG: Cytochrome c biosis protein [Ilumatobacteraceae bacterium]|nr:Cytochrome c biosis protein [Ilumatobacteraceae bacterium]